MVHLQVAVGACPRQHTLPSCGSDTRGASGAVSDVVGEACDCHCVTCVCVCVCVCVCYSLPHLAISLALAWLKLSRCALKAGTRYTLDCASHTTATSPFSLIHLLRWYSCPSLAFNGHRLVESSALSIMMSLLPSVMSDALIVLPLSVVLLLFVMCVLYQVVVCLSSEKAT